MFVKILVFLHVLYAVLENIVLSNPSGQAMVSDDYCGVYNVQDGPSASVQIVHNSANPTVDVYVDGGLAIEGFEYRAATPVLTLPTSFTVGIAPAGGDVIADFPFELEEGGSYVVVATGLLGNDDTPFGLAATGTTFGASAGPASRQRWPWKRAGPGFASHPSRSSRAGH